MTPDTRYYIRKDSSKPQYDIRESRTVAQAETREEAWRKVDELERAEKPSPPNHRQSEGA